MSYKDAETQRKYQRDWIAKRRQAWFDANGPCVDCGSWNDLELDHVDPKQKISHSIWSWSQERRNKELAKCVIRCTTCHKNKTRENEENYSGAKLSGEDVIEIKIKLSEGTSKKLLAKNFNVHLATINRIAAGTIWKHVK